MYRCRNGEVVDTPMIDEVLSEGFNYSDFIIESKKIDSLDDYDIESLAKYVLDMSKRELTEEEKLYQKYEGEIRKVQMEYDETKDSNCNSKMIKIAEKYNTLLSNIKNRDRLLERFLSVLNVVIDKKTIELLRKEELLKKKEEEKIIEEKMKAFLDTKRKEEGEQRLNDFISGKIVLGQLHLYDFLYLKDTNVYKVNRNKFMRLQRYVCSKLEMTDDEDDIYKPISELPKQKKGKRH